MLHINNTLKHSSTVNVVRILSTIMVLLASSLGVQAAANCQCLFQDGSHCCVYSDTRGVSQDCTTVCRDAHRSSDDAAYNSGGKWSKVSAWNGQFLTRCRR